jgi:formamidopyrimidine-DNA glycosylase
MPELPEVETVRRILEHHVSDALVQRVGGRSITMRRDLDLPLLKRRLTGRRLSGFRRRGKYLIVDLDDGGHALVHLGMSGRLMLQPPEAPRLLHTHLVLHLDGASELRLVDPRRFGFFVWLPPGGEAEDRSLAALGVEPLDPGLTTVLPPLLKPRRAPIKALLLDQHLVAGVGNIYANEALWRAGIDPRRAPSRISVERLTNLAGCVRDVLAEACEQGGTTIRDFATPEGDFGYFAVRLAVYGKDGQPCPNCGQCLVGAPIRGRATTWCPQCQR